jgi:hypothetical protein
MIIGYINIIIIIVIVVVVVIIFIHNTITVTKRFNSTALDMDDVFYFFSYWKEIAFAMT